MILGGSYHLSALWDMCLVNLVQLTAWLIGLGSVLQGGRIVVEGVLASCHSDWMLDDAVLCFAPHLTHLLPAVYQVRCVHGCPHVVGARTVNLCGVIRANFRFNHKSGDASLLKHCACQINCLDAGSPCCLHCRSC